VEGNLHHDETLQIYWLDQTAWPFHSSALDPSILDGYVLLYLVVRKAVECGGVLYLAASAWYGVTPRLRIYSERTAPLSLASQGIPMGSFPVSVSRTNVLHACRSRAPPSRFPEPGDFPMYCSSLLKSSVNCIFCLSLHSLLALQVHVW